MLTRGAAWFLLAASFSAGAPAREVNAQPGAPLAQEKAGGSGDWTQRRAAFLSLIGAVPAEYNRGGIPNVGEFVRANLAPLSGTAADRRKRFLIRLLDEENKTVAEKQELRNRLGLPELPPADRLTEDYLNYYGDVIAAVAGLADARSVDVLADAIATGEIARGTLISFGPAAVRPVAARMANVDYRERSSVAFTLAQMLVRSKEIANDRPSRRLISDTLRSAASDHSYLVRGRAAEGLVQLGDPESIAIVKELARADPYAYSADYPERQGRYPVREAAAAALKAGTQ